MPNQPNLNFRPKRNKRSAYTTPGRPTFGATTRPRSFGGKVITDPRATNVGKPPRLNIGRNPLYFGDKGPYSGPGGRINRRKPGLNKKAGGFEQALQQLLRKRR